MLAQRVIKAGKTEPKGNSVPAITDGDACPCVGANTFGGREWSI
jgi:hypothetical protein